MDGVLAGRHALVTGGGRGLGRVMATALAAAGARVTLTAARSRAELDETVRSLGADRCHGVMGDVSSAADCEAVAQAAQAAFGPVDILVNNAGRGPREQSAAYEREGARDPWAGDPEAFARILLTNVAGPWLMARVLVPGMVERGWGRVVNISTSRPTMLLANGGPYGPSKAALEAQSTIWAEHLAGTGVTVNLLLPGGAADTDFIPGGEPGTRATADWPANAGRVQEGRTPGLLPAAVMAAPIVWLASEASGGVTGARFVAANWPPDVSPEQAVRSSLSGSVRQRIAGD